MRKRSLDMVHALAKRDDRVVFIGSDLSPNLLGAMKKEFPSRYYMEGIAEANVIGMAAGMAMDGFVPYVNTIATFLTRRCYEQVAVDLCLHNLPVRLIANGGGMVYAPLGPTHIAIEDMAILRALPNMTVIEPSGPAQVPAAPTRRNPPSPRTPSPQHTKPQNISGIACPKRTNAPQKLQPANSTRHTARSEKTNRQTTRTRQIHCDHAPRVSSSPKNSKPPHEPPLTTNSAPPVTPEEILRQIERVPEKCDFAPYEAALLAARSHREALTPHLIAAIDRVSANPGPYIENWEDCPHLLAIYLLAEFRARWSCPVGLSDHSGTIYPALAAAPAGSVAFLPPDLATGTKSGYTFTNAGVIPVVLAQALTCNNTADSHTGFLATGNPTTDGTTGVRAFGVDQTGGSLWTGAAAVSTDAATYAEPFQYPLGITAVLVNGAVAVRDGQRGPARTGRALRVKT